MVVKNCTKIKLRDCLSQEFFFPLESLFLTHVKIMTVQTIWRNHSFICERLFLTLCFSTSLLFICCFIILFTSTLHSGLNL